MRAADGFRWSDALARVQRRAGRSTLRGVGKPVQAEGLDFERIWHPDLGAGPVVAHDPTISTFAPTTITTAVKTCTNVCISTMNYLDNYGHEYDGRIDQAPLDEKNINNIIWQ